MTTSLSSDDWVGDGDGDGRSTDGSGIDDPRVWAAGSFGSGSGSYATTGGVLQGGIAATGSGVPYALLLPEPSTGSYSLLVTTTAVQFADLAPNFSGGVCGIAARVNLATPDAIVCYWTSDGQMALAGSGFATQSAASGTINPGDQVQLRVLGVGVEVLVNDVSVLSASGAGGAGGVGVAYMNAVDATVPWQWGPVSIDQEVTPPSPPAGGTSKWYTRAAYLMTSGQFDWAAMDVRAIALTAGYTYNADHDYVANVAPSSNEVAGTVRPAVTGRTTLLDDTNNRATLFADALTFPSMAGGATCTGVALYRHGASDSDSTLLLYVDDFTAWVADGDDKTFIWPAAGLASIVP